MNPLKMKKFIILLEKFFRFRFIRMTLYVVLLLGLLGLVFGHFAMVNPVGLTESVKIIGLLSDSIIKFTFKILFHMYLVYRGCRYCLIQLVIYIGVWIILWYILYWKEYV